MRESEQLAQREWQQLALPEAQCKEMGTLGNCAYK